MIEGTITVYCECGECKFNVDGECTREYVNITDTFHADAPAACEDYEESEDKE